MDSESCKGARGSGGSVDDIFPDIHSTNIGIALQNENDLGHVNKKNQ